MEARYLTSDEIQPRNIRAQCGQIVLVFQGGGALGAYQAGVYQALHEAGIEPDWIIGTSIGAINAALLAGAKPNVQLGGLHEFWRRVQRAEFAPMAPTTGFAASLLANISTVFGGLPNFFAPRPGAFLNPLFPLGSENAGYYSTSALKSTLGELVDLAQLNSGAPRITVGAANVKTGNMHYFDSRSNRIEICHVMASGALPPAFSGGTRRRRPLLGRRHIVQHAHRGRVR